MEYLFVYGTLLAKANNEMSDFLKLNAVFFGNGYFHGRLYHTGEYPGAVLSNSINYKVYGNIYRINDPEKVFGVLDAYEEVGTQYLVPNEYKRHKVIVFIYGRKELACWVYLYNRPVNKLEQISSGDYLGILNKED